MNILIIGSPKFPIPPILGGGVQTLLYEGLILPNEKKHNVVFFFVCPYNEEAEKKSKAFSSSHCLYIRYPKIILFFDRVLNFVCGKIFKMNRTMSISYLFRTLWYIHRTKTILRKGVFDKVVVENSVPLLHCVSSHSIQKKIHGNFYFHSHSFITRFYGAKKTLLSCKKIFVVSNFMKNELIKKTCFFQISSRICVLMNKLDLSGFSATPSSGGGVREKYGFSKDDFLILFVGRLSREKGIQELLDALLLIPDKKVKLLIVGSYFYGSGVTSPFESGLKDKAKVLGDRIRFTGYISEEELFSAYHAANISVLPSVWQEPAGQTMVESLASGTPLITTLSGGIPEYMGEGNCVLLQLGEGLEKRIAASILELKNDPEKLKTYSNKGKKRSEVFSIESYLPDFLEEVDCACLEK